MAVTVNISYFWFAVTVKIAQLFVSCNILTVIPVHNNNTCNTHYNTIMCSITSNVVFIIFDSYICKVYYIRYIVNFNYNFQVITDKTHISRTKHKSSVQIYSGLIAILVAFSIVECSRLSGQYCQNKVSSSPSAPGVY